MLFKETNQREGCEQDIRCVGENNCTQDFGDLDDHGIDRRIIIKWILRK
jgi:hypothetical protein